MAPATQRYDFSTFAPSVPLTLLEVNEFLRATIAPEHATRFARVANLEKALEARMRQINARSPAIDGKSTNPFVLAAYAHLFDVQHLKQVDDIVAAAKVFSSIETAAGRVVEDVIPPFYRWQQIDSPGHTVLSEIDSARVVGDTVELVALKSGPMYINDSMVSQIANAIGTHWTAWSDHWGVDKVRYIVGMNYSTAKSSNKKDWHIVRLAEERAVAQAATVTSTRVARPPKAAALWRTPSSKPPWAPNASGWRRCKGARYGHTSAAVTTLSLRYAGQWPSAWTRWQRP